jgi:hypothetical protein
LGLTWNPVSANELAFASRARAISVNSHLSESFIAELQRLPREIDRMARFRQLVWDELRAEPGNYVRLCGRRLVYWVWFDATNPRSYLWHYRVSYLLLLGLALGGTALACRRWRGWLPIWLAVLALTAVHVLVITSARFRIPMELLLMPAAGVAMDRWARIGLRSMASMFGGAVRSERQQEVRLQREHARGPSRSRAQV